MSCYYRNKQHELDECLLTIKTLRNLGIKINTKGNDLAVHIYKLIDTIEHSGNLQIGIVKYITRYLCRPQ